MEDEKKRVGLIIRQMREELDLTQVQLAQLIEVSSQTVSNWELGKSTPHLIDMTRMAKKLTISLDRFTNFQETEIESKLRQQEIQVESMKSALEDCLASFSDQIFKILRDLS